MSTAIAKNLQVGSDSTATNNFTIFQPATPDGTLRIGNGNTGITASLLTINSAGAITQTAATANGVMFANGSKVLTTGTGLQFDGSNLGLGVTPSAWGAAWRAYQYVGGSMASPNGSNNLILQNAYNDGTNYRYIGTAAASYYQQSAGQHIWVNAPSGTAGNAISFTQAMTLDASGNLLLGTTSSQARFGNGQFLTAGMISTTANFAPSSSMGSVLAFGGGVGSPVAARVYFGDGTGWEWDWGSVNNSAVYTRRFVFTDTGYAYNTTGTWGTISDARLKENIVDATPKLDELMQLRVRNFNFIAEPDRKQIGFVAQEVEAIFPGLVENSKPDGDGNSRKAVKTTVLIPMLIKAMQEQQAIIESLTARVAQLEAK